MNSSPENFDPLQKLLRLKRYEQPPPRYFNEFSSQVIDRIQAESSVEKERWWHRFGFDLRPAVGLGVGAFACTLLFLGLTADPINEQGLAGAPFTAAGANPQAFTVASPEVNPDANSTNPVINAAGTMMINPFRPRVSPASYQPQ